MLILKKIRYKNFLSTGNSFIEYDLNKYKSVLISGKNGTGKTQTLDAIFFALYNRPYRKINKPELVNSYNQKDTVCEVEFTTNGREYLVRRGIKPSLFEIYDNGILINQDSTSRNYQDYLENHILKLNYKAFSQTIILGSARYVPFMQLIPMERKKVVENILDIEIFSTMSTILKERIGRTRSDVQELEYKIEIQNEKIKGVNNLINTRTKDFEKDTNQIIDNINKQELLIIQLNSTISKLEQEIEEKENQLPNISKVQKNIKLLNNSNVEINSKINNNEKTIKFFEKNNNCPTCKQNIDETFKQETIQNKASSNEELKQLLSELNESLTQFNNKIEDYNQKQKIVNDLRSKLRETNLEKRIVEQSKKSYEDELKESTIVRDTSIDENHKELRDLTDSLEQMNSNLSTLHSDLNVMNLNSQLLKDNTGIKAHIIKKYIPIFNKLVNHYLQQMNLFCHFEIDEEFNDKIMQNFQNEMSYHSLSEGQKKRVDLAILFTWRRIAHMRSSVACSLLFLDEILDSSLDTEGVEDLIKIIQELAEKENIFVITHKADQLSSHFEKVIKIRIYKNFTVVE